MSLQISVEMITPEVAEAMLTLNTRNRSVSSKHVSALASAIRRGEWTMNGDAIRIGDNTLLDGQHRLHAVIASGIAVQSVVVRGLQSTVFDTIDIGKRRSAGDAYDVIGEKNTKVLAGAIRFILSIKSNQTLDKTSYSNHEMLEALARFPSARDSVKLIKSHATSLAPGSILCGLHYLFSEKDKAAAEKFYMFISTGIGFDHGTPMFLLRERLIDNAASRAKLERAYVAALCIKAWNATRRGQSLKCLKMADGEAFPIIE